MLKSARYLLVFTAFLTVTGCENARFGNREKGALGGTAVGAGLGAIVGNQFGHPGAGVAIGSAFGALSGAAIGQGMDNQEDQANAADRRLDEQDRELRENRRLIDQLRAGGIDARETKRGIVMNLPDVLFEFDSSRLTREAESKINTIADSLHGLSDRQNIAVEGYTDSVGSESYNQRLSEERARSVARALEHDGIASRRLSVKGFGESKPVASNATEHGRSENRRVEVIVERR